MSDTPHSHTHRSFSPRSSLDETTSTRQGCLRAMPDGYTTSRGFVAISPESCVLFVHGRFYFDHQQSPGRCPVEERYLERRA